MYLAVLRWRSTRTLGLFTLPLQVGRTPPLQYNFLHDSSRPPYREAVQTDFL